MLNNKKNRTTIQVSLEMRKKLSILENHYDKPLNRIVNQIINNEVAKLPKDGEEVASR